MAKLIPDEAMDTELAWIAQANIMHVCSTQPANYAGIAAVSLANVALTPGDGNGDFTIQNGDASGRKLSVGAQAGLAITQNGQAGHIVLASTGDSKIRHITTCTAQQLNTGGTVDVPGYDADEIGDVS